jgi:lysophospholipase L1-like esterase
VTIRFAYAGDSLTAGSSSWLNQWEATDVLPVGGFARSQYTTGQVLAAIEPQPDADVLVIMLGTNDARLGVDTDTILANLDAIAAKVGAPRVILCYTPPSDYTEGGPSPACVNGSCRTIQYVLNRDFHLHAFKRGWFIADPWAKVRLMNNGWSSGADTDGRHPTADTSVIVRNRLELYIRQAVNGA